MAEAALNSARVQLELRRDRRAARRHGAAPARRRTRAGRGGHAGARARRAGPGLRRAHRARGSRDRAGALGDAAQVRLDALPDATLDGKVTEVAERGRCRERHVPHRSGARSDRPAAEERPGREADRSCRRRPRPARASTCRSARSSKATAAPRACSCSTRTMRADATSKSHSSKATTSRSSAASRPASRSSPTARSISKTASRSRSPSRSPTSRQRPRGALQ